MSDPPHLLKNIRNNMKKHGYSMGENSISWDHVQTFYEVDTSKPIRMAPKLTKNHITLPPLKGLMVYLAAQVLSHTVASGLALMAQWELIPCECLARVGGGGGHSLTFHAKHRQLLTFSHNYNTFIVLILAIALDYLNCANCLVRLTRK